MIALILEIIGGFVVSLVIAAVSVFVVFLIRGKLDDMEMARKARVTR